MSAQGRTYVLVAAIPVLILALAAAAQILPMRPGVWAVPPLQPVPARQLDGVLPAEWPAGFPVYPGATPRTVWVVVPGTAHESDIFDLAVEANPATVLGWYRRELPVMGWQLERDQCCGVPDVAFASRAQLLTGSVTASTVRGTTTIDVQFHHSVAADWNHAPLPWWQSLAPVLPAVGLLVGLLVKSWRRRRAGPPSTGPASLSAGPAAPSG